MKLPKRYLHGRIESEIFEQWQEEKLYTLNKNDLRAEELFTIDTPPPYTNAPWHIGGAIHYSQIDIIARTMRLLGKKVLFPIGLDRNGLPIEIAAEKEFGVSMFETPRTEFILMCQKVLEKYGLRILELAHRLGMSCNRFDWEGVYKTDQPEYRSLTQKTFIDLWNMGMIYEDERPSNWDPKLQSTIADSEIEYREESHRLYRIKFLADGEEYSFATTRPELILAIRLIVYNPSDKRYQHLEGKEAEIPLVGISVPILPDNEADSEYGTGLVQICSFGDLMDIKILRSKGIKPRYVITEEGKMAPDTGKYEGMSIENARRQIIADLEELGVLEDLGKYQYRQPYSDRSGAKVEFLGKKEFYLKQMQFTDTLKVIGADIEFLPESSRQIWKNWMDAIKIDWPISRRRYYGTEIPLWYCVNDHPNLPEGGEYYQPWKDEPPFKKCSTCGSSAFRGEERTFDTWMDSSISALYTSMYPENVRDEEFFNIASSREYLADIRPQGKDIVRTWLHYSVLRIYQLLEKPAFKRVWISGHVVTANGTKMSKRLGNSVDPMEILEAYGADVLRLYGVLEVSHGSDLRFNEKHLQGTAKFITKLYNIGRFISQFGEGGEVSHPTDIWMQGQLSKYTQKIRTSYETLNFQEVARSLRKFTQEIFASHYLELVKNRAYNRTGEFSKASQDSAMRTLRRTFRNILILFAPISPFVTDYLHRFLFKNSVHTESFPQYSTNVHMDDSLIEFNQLIWKIKRDAKLALRDPLLSCQIPEELQEYADDLCAMHRIQDKGTGDSIYIFYDQEYSYSF